MNVKLYLRCEQAPSVTPYLGQDCDSKGFTQLSGTPPSWPGRSPYCSAFLFGVIARSLPSQIQIHDGGQRLTNDLCKVPLERALRGPKSVVCISGGRLLVRWLL
ncbi:hypothetical protein VZT92_007071 [Zoarces viviparus]|uniref:Uncharacterized protein n=1 Tax=Zoarces viviparus TaxID=48416 RepID=A0AAW1FJ75_ZOAVI